MGDGVVDFVCDGYFDAVPWSWSVTGGAEKAGDWVVFELGLVQGMGHDIYRVCRYTDNLNPSRVEV